MSGWLDHRVSHSPLSLSDLSDRVRSDPSTAGILAVIGSPPVFGAIAVTPAPGIQPRSKQHRVRNDDWDNPSFALSMPPSTHNSNLYCRSVLGSSARRDQEHESPFGTARTKPSFSAGPGLAEGLEGNGQPQELTSGINNIVAINTLAAVVF
ncbi:hypothetical protein LA080_006687 [Diaporthe eres]|nr:hypothetical protein LA080_006687 [Diaporthe eres]